MNDNISKMMTEIQSKDLLDTTSTENRGLVNMFTGKIATILQTHDLLHFREVGEREYVNFIKSRILREATNNNAPVRKQRLQTMAETKFGRRTLIRR